MKIVILDAYPANPGDLSWDPVRALGDLIVYEHCPHEPEETVRRCAGAEIVLTNKVPFTRDIMRALPGLRLIALQSTGYNIVDLAAAKELGITVCNVPGYSTMPVAQLVFAFILAFKNGVTVFDDAAKKGFWSQAPDFTFYPRPVFELDGSTLGIFGFGAIGQTVGRIGAAFGMKILYAARSDKEFPFAERVEPDRLLAESDILTLHAPQTQQTACFINERTLKLMKPSAILINTARGGLVDSRALADALNGGRLAGAGIDVLEQEPPPADHPLLHAKNILLTPHVGWASAEARGRLIRILAENIRAFQAGAPIHVVNP